MIRDNAFSKIMLGVMSLKGKGILRNEDDALSNFDRAWALVRPLAVIQISHRQIQKRPQALPAKGDSDGDSVRCTQATCHSAQCTAGPAPSMWPLTSIGRGDGKYLPIDQLPPGCTCTHKQGFHDESPAEPSAGAGDMSDLAQKLRAMRDQQKELENNLRE